MEPVRERIYFAGEAVHETLWGTMAGAWDSGERAAAAALRTMTGGGSAGRTRKPSRAKDRRQPSIAVEPPAERERPRSGGFWFFR
jgi:hypothetical protein